MPTPVGVESPLKYHPCLVDILTHPSEPAEGTVSGG
jgi:hypothetical protein